MPRCPRFLLPFALAALACAATGAATAQQAPPGAAPLLERWVEVATRAEDAAERIRYREAITREIDGPFAVRRVRIVQDVTITGDRVRRHIHAAEMDDEPIEADRVAHMNRRLRRALGPDYEIATRAGDLAPEALANLRPVGAPRRDRVDNRTLWRVELSPENLNHPVEHATLWMTPDRAAPLLVRSRIRLHGTEPGSVITVYTDYRAVRGPAGTFALPSRQRSEAVLTQRRRWRTFTVVVTSERAIDDVDVRWRR
jgi:hypothetical protein